jgi:hypothetical protein
MLIAALALLIDPTVAPQDPPPAPPSVIRIDPQIQSWLDRSPARTDGERGPAWDDDRTWGEFSVSVGTGGWRSYGGSLSTPAGEGGRVTLHYLQSEGEGLRRRPYGYGYDGYDPYWGGGLGADDRPLHRAGSSID